MNSDHSPQWFRIFTAEFEWKNMNRDHSTQWCRMISAEFGWKIWILVTPHSDSVYFQLKLNDKHESWSLYTVIPCVFSSIWMIKVNPDHSTQWFCIITAEFDRKTRILITPLSDSAYFQLDLNEGSEFWSLHTVIPYIYSWISMRNMKPGHSTQWGRVFSAEFECKNTKLGHQRPQVCYQQYARETHPQHIRIRNVVYYWECMSEHLGTLCVHQCTLVGYQQYARETHSQRIIIRNVVYKRVCLSKHVNTLCVH